jgi:hypothetical protein
MKPVEATFVLHPEHNQYTARHAQGQTRNIDERKYFVPQ